jgi:hypothetical protein
MDAGVVSGTSHLAPDSLTAHRDSYPLEAGASEVPATLRVTAAQGHLRRHRSSAMRSDRRRRASLHLPSRRS